MSEPFVKKLMKEELDHLDSLPTIVVTKEQADKIHDLYLVSNNPAEALKKVLNIEIAPLEFLLQIK